MDYLVIQLQAQLSSWGDPAVGGHRGTAEFPGQSALLGLLGAALGLDRADDQAHASLRDSLGFAVAVLETGSLLRDYQTAQVPPENKLKGRPHVTRRHELSVPKHELGNAILSTRDYRQNSVYLVAICIRQGVVSPYSLQALADALKQPRYVLYLGRKSCAPIAPLWPQVLAAASANEAFAKFKAAHEQARQLNGQAFLEPLPAIQRMAFDEHIKAGVSSDLMVRRQDRLIRRVGWLFGDRTEHIHLCKKEDDHVPE
jgi:CRISPR system Cascade subunit CasD